MSRAYRAVVGTVVAFVMIAVGLALMLPTATYGYDGAQATAPPVVEATPPPPAELGEQRAPVPGDSAGSVYDSHSQLARTSPSVGAYRLAPRAIPGGGGGTTPLFRHVSPEELADIRATGRFNLGPNSTGNYFAESQEHASKWGAWLNRGQGAVVETRVPTTYADQLMRWEKLDGIGPARFVPPDQLNWLNDVMNGIREVPS